LLPVSNGFGGLSPVKKHWSIPPDVLDPEVLREVAAVIHRGGVVAYPTDTLYGLAADPWNEDAISRVFAIKGRDAVQAIPLIAADREQVEAKLGALSPLAARLAGEFWPGPLTLVVPALPSVPRALLGAGDTVAVRVPDHPVATALARAVGHPITSTSANPSGQPATDDAATVLAIMGDRLDGVLDAGRTPGGPPSTLVDTCGAEPRLLRPGAVSWDRVVQFLSS
jgi:L-threonylcarbamoyladenylate synthase